MFILLLLLFFLFILLDLAALRWGADSRDTIDSPEWERRAHSRTRSIF